MKKLLSALLIFTILAGAVLPVSATTHEELDAAITRTVSYIQRTVRNPQVGSVGGEWTILGLARSGRPVPNLFFQRYLRNVERYLRERDGVLCERRLTEYSRVILALTAAGFDPRSVAGFDLTLPLTDFERTVWQGINGAIFALLAIDSLDYDVPTRDMFVQEILDRQAPDGGWSLRGDIGDPDITGMALQALAKYTDDSYVYAAVERALEFLSFTQNDKGGFVGGLAGSEPSVESAVQVLVALAELGISFDDQRFIKNDKTVLDNVLSFQLRDGSFRHTKNCDESNLMSTEIALYGLVAAQRAIEGKNSLYRMDDRVVR
ncbi:MAG: terpene cyclase/mutase family protein [Defluviitaleaceae bacterium]|nr:terpene cyclase/mutase family protein [Defluviitaleaceae bacterium]